jgi:GTP-binding protein HflX
VVTDTVGFIRKLPPHLVASFRSTLDEVRLADLLLHVVDISHPDYLQHINKVNQVLSELGSLDKSILMIYNKIDKLSGEYPINLSPYSEQKNNEVFVSAQNQIGISDLAKRIAEFAKGDWAEASLYLANGNSDLLPYVYKMGVVTQSKFEKEGIRLRIRGKRENLQKIRKLNSELKLKFLPN